VATTTRTVRCRNVRGALLEIELTDRGEFVTPGSLLEQGLVVAANQQVFVRKWVSPMAGRHEPWRYDLLDNEIRAGARLGQVFGDRYPQGLARLAAYNVDADEPFVLLYRYFGEPALEIANRLDEEQRRQFQVGLLHAVEATTAAGVVHGALTLDAVRWDGRRVQIVDFELAERVGERRRRSTSAARSPEQAAGAGVVDARDDLWGAGQIIRTLYMGEPVTGPSADRDGEPERLRALLDPIFRNPLEVRPHPADLLNISRAPRQHLAAVDPERGLTAGREQFDRQCAAKRRPAQRDVPPRRARSGIRGLLPFLAVLVVAMVVVGMVVLG
jgi:hypothetical protein